MEIRQKKLIELCTDPNLENLISEYEKTFCKIYGFENRGKGGEEEDKIKKEIKDILDTILDYKGFYKGKQIEKKLWNRYGYAHIVIGNILLRIMKTAKRQQLM